MKKISFLFLACVYIWSCGERHHRQHDNCGHDHTQETNHTHEHGADCKHDHVHEAGKPHSHTDGRGHEHDHGHAGHAHPHDHGSGDAPEPGPGEIFFSDEQAAISVFGLYTVQPQTFHAVIPASGKIFAAQGDEFTAAATFNGIVSFSSKKIAPGTAVSKGEPLFYISSRDIAEGDLVTRTTALYEQARTAYERAKRLIGDRIITQSEYEEAKLNYETAKAGYEALAQKSGGKGTGVTSGISGFIKKR